MCGGMGDGPSYIAVESGVGHRSKLDVVAFTGTVKKTFFCKKLSFSRCKMLFGEGLRNRNRLFLSFDGHMDA